MVAMLTLGEALGVAATTPGEPLGTGSAMRFSTAGAEATVAIGMSRLGHTAVWVGVVGDDEVGRCVIRDLRREGVNADLVRVTGDATTGFMLRDHRTPDHVGVSYYRTGSAGAQLCGHDVDAAFHRTGDIGLVHLTGITPMLSGAARGAVHRALELARERAATVSLDVNYRRALGDTSAARAELEAMLPYVDILFIGEDELFLLTHETEPENAARFMVTLGPREVVVKLGERGAYALDADGATAREDGLPVTVIDVIGAGDSFAAGYLAAWSENRPLTERLRWANACAACTVGTRGDWEGLPSRAELPMRAQVGAIIR
ncbi:MAG: sugar kinase [Mycobacterium sp.]